MSLVRVKGFFSSNSFAIILRIAFVGFIILGERLFLGIVNHSQGKADILTSLSMMLILIFLIERFAHAILRKTLLLLAGSFLIIFHLLCGLYYRFFNCTIPFDIFNQWHDIFVVGGYGASLMSGLEITTAIMIPSLLLIMTLFKPAKVKPLVFVILMVLTVFGWHHRLNRSVHRQPHKMSSLPDFIHRHIYFWYNLGRGEDRYIQLVSNVEAAIPRHLKGYKTVKDNGIMVEPVETVQDSEPRDYNVIFILMESIRAYESGFMGAKQSFTPNLDKLTEKALVYNNFYANGSQTVRAELASLCSVYSNPIGVPDYLVNPHVSLISLPEILGDFGYDTLWFSGYTADFHNKRAFLSSHGVKKIYDRDVLPEAEEPEIGWGMNDCELFDNVWPILKEAKEPFFAQITTLSNHVAEHTEYPLQSPSPKEGGSEEYIKYTEGIYYTDYAVSRFIQKVLASDLAKNTIIVITGDHGLWLFPDRVKSSIQKLETMFRGVLCIWGPEEIITPGRDDTLGSQVDLAPTLMDYLNIRHKNTFLGQSLLNRDITSDDRCVITLLGSVPHIRVGDTYSLSNSRLDKETRDIGRYAKVENMDSYTKDTYSFMKIKGDLLHGEYKIEAVTNEEQNSVYTKRLDDIVFLTSYGLYMNAYEGVKE